jgi:hypothetical protein
MTGFSGGVWIKGLAKGPDGKIWFAGDFDKVGKITP